MKTLLALSFACLAAAHAPVEAQSGTVIPRTTTVAPGLPPAGASQVRMCVASDLSLATDDENGSFNGMSHSGTLVVLRNLSPTACRVPAIPQIGFFDASGALKATGQNPGFLRPGMGHGPVVLPVVIPADAEVTSKLRWVSGEVYRTNTCITPTRLAVTIGGKQQTVSIGAHLCGDAAAGGVTYEQTRFAPDPVYTPDRTVRAPQLPQPE